MGQEMLITETTSYTLHFLSPFLLVSLSPCLLYSAYPFCLKSPLHRLYDQ
jgi:hypothetical protein